MPTFEELINQNDPIHKLLKKYFSKRAKLVIFDIGSCDGIDTIRYYNLFPHAAFHVFEPHPDNFEITKNNLSKFLNTEYKLSKLGVSNEEKEMTFYLSSGQPPESDVNWDYGNKSSSLLEPCDVNKKYEWLKFKKQIKIQTLRLDNYLKSEKVDCIDYIHMDIQGAEMMALVGLGTDISKVKSIFLEVSNLELYKDQSLKIQIEQFLTENGFTLIYENLVDNEGDQFYVNLDFFPTYKLKNKIYLLFSKTQKLLKTKKKYSFIHDCSSEDFKKRRKFYNQLLPNGGVIFDIGANYGNRIEPVIDLNFKIIAVEPQTECVNYLMKRYGNKLEIVKKGLSDKKEFLPIYQSKESVLTSFSKEWIDKVQSSGRFDSNIWAFDENNTIEMTTFDELISQYGIPNFAKIDVEGFELKVLSGLTQKIPLISLEYTTPELSENLIKCIEYLHDLSADYTFNYSVGETMNFASDYWLNFSDFLKLIKSELFQNTRFGDIYARLSE